MAQIGSIGAKLDLLVKQGCTFGPHEVTLTNPDKTAVDLTDCTLRGQIRKTAGDTVVAATIAFVVTSATSGKFTFGMADDVTAALVAGETLDKPASLYTWDADIVDALGETIPLYYGDVKVFRGVTRG